jgi:hypothetical protein
MVVQGSFTGPKPSPLTCLRLHQADLTEVQGFCFRLTTGSIIEDSPPPTSCCHTARLFDSLTGPARGSPPALTEADRPESVQDVVVPNPYLSVWGPALAVFSRALWALVRSPPTRRLVAGTVQGEPPGIEPRFRVYTTGPVNESMFMFSTLPPGFPFWP